MPPSITVHNLTHLNTVVVFYLQLNLCHSFFVMLLIYDIYNYTGPLQDDFILVSDYTYNQIFQIPLTATSTDVPIAVPYVVGLHPTLSAVIAMSVVHNCALQTWR